jgi:hypothetical protein
VKQYLLSVYQPDGPAPVADVLEQISQKLDALNDDMRTAGAWVFAGGLHPPSTATVLRAQDGDIVTTDGPYVEGKEHLGGFTIIRAADLDAALAWGRRLAEATTLPIEVRPFQGDAED